MSLTATSAVPSDASNVPMIQRDGSNVPMMRDSNASASPTQSVSMIPQSISTPMVGNQPLPFANANPNSGKKAVHVKWAGKTIALGTFPHSEADEKCARAKALTRAWRSTMRPKPTREWVMLELERLQVRVVSGRLGRRGSTGDSPDEETDDDDDDDDDSKKPVEKKKKREKQKKPKTPPNQKLPNSKKGSQGKAGSVLKEEYDTIHNNMLQGQFRSVQRRNSFVAPPNTMGASLLGLGTGDNTNPGGLDWASTDASAGLVNTTKKIKSEPGSDKEDPGKDRRNSLMAMAEAAAVSDAGQPVPYNVNSPDGNNESVPPHRPLVGGGSAAAYEAARADHYRNVANQNKRGTNKDKSKDGTTTNIPNNNAISGQENQSGFGLDGMNNSASGAPLSGGLGGLGGLGGANAHVNGGAGSGLLGQGGVSGTGIPQLGLSVNPNQHYEMLKLHHMNLLNEIQETTLMMNLYQQQQLQQQQFQQQQLDQQNFSSQSDQQLALQLAQQQEASANSNLLFNSLYGMGGAGGIGGTQNLSGLGGTAGLQQAQQQRGLGLGGVGGAGSASNQMQALLRQHNLLSGGMLSPDSGAGFQRRLSLSNQSSLLGQEQPLTLAQQEELCQARLQRLKQDIAERQRMADALEGGASNKRNLANDNSSSYKRQRNSEEN